MNYGRIGVIIGFGIMAICAVGALIGVAALWIGGAPLVVSIGTTVLILAVATMVVCLELDDRR